MTDDGKKRVKELLLTGHYTGNGSSTSRNTQKPTWKSICHHSLLLLAAKEVKLAERNF